MSARTTLSCTAHAPQLDPNMLKGGVLFPLHYQTASYNISDTTLKSDFSWFSRNKDDDDDDKQPWRPVCPSPNPYQLGELVAFSRHDSEDHKDMGGKEEKGADEMGYGKGRTKDSDGEMTGWKTRDEMGRKHRIGQSKGEACR